MSSRKSGTGVLMIAAFATLCLVAVLTPMRSVLLWSTVLAVLFARPNERLVTVLGTRNRASLVTVFIILVAAVVPIIVLAILVVNQVNMLVEQSDQIAASFHAISQQWLQSVPTALRGELDELLATANIGAKDISSLVLPALGYTVSIGGNLAYLVGTIFAALYVAFFFLRDHAELRAFLAKTVPLNPAQKAILSNRLANTVAATVRGVILVAAAQALAAGIIFWLLGLQAYAVLAALTFVACLIPAIGAGLVWVPVAVYFLVTGDITRGVVMVAAGLLVIGMVDNILRPRLIAERAALPDFLIFLSSFGGLILLGFDGLFLGPIVAGLFVESWKMYFVVLEARHSAAPVAGPPTPAAQPPTPGEVT